MSKPKSSSDQKDKKAEDEIDITKLRSVFVYCFNEAKQLQHCQEWASKKPQLAPVDIGDVFLYEDQCSG